MPAHPPPRSPPESSPFGLDQGQRLPRRQRDALHKFEAAAALPQRIAPRTIRTTPQSSRCLHRFAVCSSGPCEAFPLRLSSFLSPARRPSQASRVTRTANCVSTTSNSLHASCTSPAASGRSFPWLHCDSINCPGSSASRFAPGNPAPAPPHPVHRQPRHGGPNAASRLRLRTAAAQEPAPASSQPPLRRVCAMVTRCCGLAAAVARRHREWLRCGHALKDPAER